MLYSQPLLPPLHAKTTMQIRSASNTNEINWDDPLNKGLTAWYPFRQKGGNVLRDVVGDNHGTLESSMTGVDWVLSPETKSLALDFDGTDDVVTVGSTQLKSIATNSCSIVCTFKIRSDGENDLGTIFDNYTPGAGGIYLLTRGVGMTLALQGGVGFSGGDLTHITDSNAIAIGEWTTIALVYDAKTDILRLYKNGLVFPFPNTSSAGTTSGIATLDFTIGNRSAGDRTADGPISDTRIYNRALSESEVHDLYQASRTGYVNQFKRRYFPVSLQTEEPPTETTTSGLIRLKSPKRSEPSYRAGYAKSASESANPKLWDGLIRAWVPALGPTHNVLRDVSPAGVISTIANQNEDWIVGEDGYALNLDGSSVLIDCGNVPIGSSFTVSQWLSYDNAGGPSQTSISCRSDNRPDSNRVAFQLNCSGGQQVLVARDSSKNLQSVTGTKSVVNNQWNHLAGTFSPNELKIYEDGVETNSAARTIDNVDADRVVIGCLWNDATNTYDTNYFDGQVGTTLIFNRLLSGDEIKLLHTDPLAPFRQRRYFPVSLTTEEPPTETATSGLIRLKSPKQSQPSYKAGYAKSASESAYPELWDGLVGAWVPGLGPTGTKVFDASGRSHNALLTAMDPATDWVRQGEHTALDFDGTSDYLEVEESSRAEWAFVQNTLDFTISLRFRVNELGTRDILFGTTASSNEKGFWAQVLTDGRFQFNAFNSVGTNTANRTVTAAQSESGSINALQWHSVVIVGDSENFACRIHVDGVDTTSFVTPFSGFATGDSTRSLNIGRSNLSSTIDPLDGQIASFAIWDKSLGSTSVKRLSADPLAPFRQRRYAPFSLTTEEPPTTFNHWYALPGRIHRFIGLGVHV